MKNVLLMTVLCMGMAACADGESKSLAANQQTKKDVVGVLYFHGTQRCATCMAIEKNTNALVESAYAEQLKSGMDIGFQRRADWNVYGKMQTMQKWLNIAVGVLFIAIGIYYCLTIYF